MMIMCDFCALRPVQRKILLNKFITFLKPGGKVLLDVYSLIGFSQRQESTIFETDLLNGFWSPETYYGFQHTFIYEEVKVVLDKFTLIEPKSTRTIYNWLQYYSPDSLKKEFVDCGFTVEKFYTEQVQHLTPKALNSPWLPIK